jgi:hypothetical protein
MLSTLGVYMGPECRLLTPNETAAPPDAPLVLSGYAEADDFRFLNDQLLMMDAGAAWNHIEPFLERRRQSSFARPRLVFLSLATFGRLRHRYLQPLPVGFRGPWGWKDPRNSLTLPYWLHLFPQAQILHVRRDREAVVESLHHRARVWQASPAPPLPLAQRAQRWVRHPGTTVRRAGRRLGLIPAPAPDACLDRDYCRSLCDQYVHECLDFRPCGDRYREVSYEEIRADPAAAARQLASFAGCAPSRSRLSQAVALVRRGSGQGQNMEPRPRGVPIASR